MIGLLSIASAIVGLTTSSAALGCVAAAFGLYLLLLSGLALLHSGSQRPAVPSTSVCVLIPAHNESGLITRCVASLLDQSYPRELYRIIVVADNCTDDTAAISVRAGADEVMVRQQPELRGKGRALRWAMDRILTGHSAPAAIVVVDADSIADPGLLEGLVGPFEAGARAVQGQSLLYPGAPTRPADALRVAAFLLVNRTRPTGRDVLGLPAHLGGNGMLIASELLGAKPWAAFTSAEDLEYSLELSLAGIRVAFAATAVVLSPTAPNPAAAAQQELRWQGGKAYLARRWMRRLLVQAIRSRSPLLLTEAFELAVPPLGLLAAGVVAGTAVAAGLAFAGLASAWSLIPWLLALASVPLHVLVGLRAARAPGFVYRALLRAPGYMVSSALRLHRVLRFRGDSWMRTERESLADTVKGPV